MVKFIVHVNTDHSIKNKKFKAIHRNLDTYHDMVDYENTNTIYGIKVHKSNIQTNCAFNMDDIKL